MLSPKNRLTRKLIIQSLTVCAVVIFLVGGLQTYSAYRQRFDAINRVFADIGQSHVPILARALWLLDDKLIESGLEAITDLSFVEQAVIVENGVRGAYSGKVVSKDVVVRDFPLTFHDQKLDRTLGTLQVICGVDELHNTFRHELASLFLRQGVEILFIAAVLYLLFHRHVARHLAAVADQARDLDMSAGLKPFTLPRPPSDPGYPDELDVVVDALNEMEARVQALHDAQQLELERRRVTEVQLLEARDTLEQRVEERTRELAAANRDLDKANENLAATNLKLMSKNRELLFENEERKRAEQALRDSEARQRTVVERMPIMLAALDESGSIIAWNSECVRVTGYTEAAMMADPKALSLVCPDEQIRAKAMESLLARENFRGLQVPFVTKDGSQRSTAWSSIAGSFPIPGWHTWAVGIDETDRECAQRELQSLNRALETLVRSNEIVLHEKNPEALCRKVCRVGVQIGGYDFAAVVCTGQDKTAPISATASYGSHEDFLQTLTPYLQAQDDQCPTALAIRTGQHVLVPSIEDEQRYPEWRETALAEGFRSCINLPLRTGPHILGSLMLYSTAPHAFDGKEIAVLERLANNLAYGLHALDLDRRRRSAEENLRRQEALLLDTQSIARVGGWELDWETGTFAWTPETYQIFGLPPAFAPTVEDILGLFPERKTLRKAFSDAYSKGTSFEIETPIATTLGERRFVRVQGAAQSVDGGSTKIAGVIQDITERKTAERNLERIFTLSQDLICIVSFDGYLTQLNPAWQKVLGWSQEKLKSMPVIHFVHPDDQERTIQSSEPMLDGLALSNFQNRFLHKDGSYRWLSWNSIPELESEQVFSVARDVTQERIKQEELIAAKQQAEASSLAKSEFLANMSHEIRTPINGVLGMLQLLEFTDLNDEQHEYVETARTSGQNLLALISDILDLSRVEAGKLTIIDSPFEVREIIQTVRDTFREPAREKDLALDVVLEPDTPEILYGDAGRLRQILFNLVGNAVKFTESGGRVSVHASTVTAPDGTLRLVAEVSDTGIGMDETQLSHIFEPFAQVEKAYSRDFQGAGLGLAIVKRLVLLLGGELCVDSTPGRGTYFHFSIPMARRERLTEVQEPAAPRRNGPVNVLVVEDNAINRFALVTMIEKWGHASTGAASAEEALELLAANTYDVVFMDVQMPAMNGLEATRIIRSGERAGIDPDVTIVAISAYAMPGDKETFLESGMDSYFAKPVDMEALQRYLDSFHSHRASPA
ncbi:PAS domain S-box protein [Oceanidesulfovibrio marinus]|uniref:Sensory/regulatory protein RpfC n=1 Tax=Oceanidesulfovibrio marinus TaxID=370038 RepID=A0A6P1ZF91_9BACT|nr:PAS domain S-box protein [Oceanidesulfovibrio marinus]TVM32750.1 hypothetical protein DQK91_13645 [Oceanidesulfovibrio marinus]